MAFTEASLKPLVYLFVIYFCFIYGTVASGGPGSAFDLLDATRTKGAPGEED